MNRLNVTYIMEKEENPVPHVVIIYLGEQWYFQWPCGGAQPIMQKVDATKERTVIECLEAMMEAEQGSPETEGTIALLNDMIDYVKSEAGDYYPPPMRCTSLDLRMIEMDRSTGCFYSPKEIRKLSPDEVITPAYFRDKTEERVRYKLLEIDVSLFDARSAYSA